MEQDVENEYRTVCTTCLCSDRDLYSINNVPQIDQIFKLLMYDYAPERVINLPEIEQLVCWECLALMKRFLKFKWQVQNAQDHLRILSLSRSAENMDHTYITQSLSSLTMLTKSDYDRIYFDFSTQKQCQQYIDLSTVTQEVKNEQYDLSATVASTMDLVPNLVISNPVTGLMSHIVVGSGDIVSTSEPFSSTIKGPMLTIGTLDTTAVDNVIVCQKPKADEINELKLNYLTEHMSEADMLASREQAKQGIAYASSVYKCELCIIGFYTQHQVQDHFVTVHKPREGAVTCKICYIYLDEASLSKHVESHYMRYICKLCGHVEYTKQKIKVHDADTHQQKRPIDTVRIGDVVTNVKKGRLKKLKEKSNKPPPKPGDLRKLLSKTTIEGYQCLECEMFFKSSRARKTHVMRCHREGLQCDHCKKKFVNKNTLTIHLRLHQGPLPRKECPICRKMVRVIQLKYHIQRHQNKTRYECVECKKIYSSLATYQAHFKYARAHATDQVLKFPCPMCNKGYPTKESMQDHFNYQHLGKTYHKCPICDKPIATKKNVERHMMRVHSAKQEKPRNHFCQQCGKAFSDRKALVQHEAIHSGERPLSCDVCRQTFKQKASLYTHRKRVHKLFPPKKVLQFMDTTPDTA